MQFRTEVNLEKLRQFMSSAGSVEFHFNDIKKSMGWDNRRTTDVLRKAEEAGYVEKVPKGRTVVYRYRIKDYSGEFDAFEFLTQVDESCRENGNFLGYDLPLSTFVHIYVQAYGIPPMDKLTEFEQELLFSILARHAKAFYDFADFSDAVRKRQEIERRFGLPDSVKSAFLAEENIESRKPFSVQAAWALYGDVMWEHVFDKIQGDIRF